MSVKVKFINNKKLLLQKVISQESDYDPEVSLLLRPLHSPGYHTTLTLKSNPFVHPTHQSLLYALALLNTEAPEYVGRACDVIRRILTLQDQDPDRDTYGIWPWFYEEPLDRMAPPDWNWADFCGKELVQVERLHGARLPSELRDQIRLAVRCACDAIIKRDVGPHYTNIAIMGAFVTLLAGESYGWQNDAKYALRRLEKLMLHMDKLGTLQEFNSPHYSVIAIVELSKIQTYTTNDRAKEIATRMLDRVWKMVTEHYHPVTKQWAGPHSRNYGTLLNDKIKSFLQLATDHRVTFFPDEDIVFDAEWYGSGSRCPDCYLELFQREDSRFLEQPYYRNEETGFAKWAYTYLKPAYTIGMFGEEIMWNQTRGFVAYFENNGETTYLQMRCLHDGYDYCSAVLSVAAKDDLLLLGVRFLTNGGDTHPNLDRIQGKVEAEDFRLRMELGGCMDRVSVDTNGAEAQVVINGLALRFDSLYAAFGVKSSDVMRDWEWEANKSDNSYGLDLTIYGGRRRTIDFQALDKAAFLISLAIGEAAEKVKQIAVVEEAEQVTAQVIAEQASGLQHQLSIPLKPNDNHPI